MNAASWWRRMARRWRAVLGALVVIALVLAVVRYWPRDPLSASVSQSVAVLDRHGRLLRLSLSGDERYRLWTPIEEMPPELVAAVLLQEDAWFRWHPGVNPVSLLRGAWSTYGSGEARIGGSTLTMQLARLRWKLDTRTPRGKIEQMMRALQLEACHGKREILEAYLNLAPYGGNIEGVGAASQIYFHKVPVKLTLPESLTLAVLPQAPSRRGRLREDPAAGATYLGKGLEAARALVCTLARETRTRPGAGRVAAIAAALACDARIAVQGAAFR